MYPVTEVRALSDPYDRVDVSEVTPVLTEKEFQEQVRQLAEMTGWLYQHQWSRF